MSWGKVLLVGLSAYAIYKECTMTKKEKIDYKKGYALRNPIWNPTGCFSSRDGVNVNKYDSKLVREMIEKYDKEYEEYCNNLPPAERVKEFYDNGGSGLNFNKVS